LEYWAIRISINLNDLFRKVTHHSSFLSEAASSPQVYRPEGRLYEPEANIPLFLFELTVAN
jgi:hypothetical protein